MRIDPEKKEERERVARELLRATLRLAAAHGFASLGLREVSRAAEIAPTSFYRHFADMEELGLALIGGMVRDFLGTWLQGLDGDAKNARGTVETIAKSAIASADRDPELLRFILAERTGAIQSFRAALEERLAVVSTTVERALSADPKFRGSHSHELVAGAAVVLILDCCGKLLDSNDERASALLARLLDQVGILLSGAQMGQRR